MPHVCGTYCLNSLKRNLQIGGANLAPQDGEEVDIYQWFSRNKELPCYPVF